MHLSNIKFSQPALRAVVTARSKSASEAMPVRKVGGPNQHFSKLQYWVSAQFDVVVATCAHSHESSLALLNQTIWCTHHD